MGKFRSHQAKSHRVRERLKNKAKAKTKTKKTEGGSDGGGGATGTGDKTAGNEARKLKRVTYGKEHSILICGDGDFSFTRGVIRHRDTGTGVVATSLDSRKTVLKKYPRAQSWLSQLVADGAQVVHSVDATRLEHALLGDAPQKEGVGSDGGCEEAREDDGGRGRKVLFDRVVFNFPHTGKQRTHLNRNLISDFFASTRALVKCADAGGEVHVTLKDKPPYSRWNVKGMATDNKLVMLRTLAFDATVFPGYRHSTTDPQAKEFKPCGAKTFVFCRGRSPTDDEVDDTGAFPVISKLTTATNSGSDGKSSGAGPVPKVAGEHQGGGKEQENGVQEGDVQGADDGTCGVEGGGEGSRNQKSEQRWVINADDSPLEEDALVSENEGLTDDDNGDGDEDDDYQAGDAGGSQTGAEQEGKQSGGAPMKQRRVADSDGSESKVGRTHEVKRKGARRDNIPTRRVEKRKKTKGDHFGSSRLPGGEQQKQALEIEKKVAQETGAGGGQEDDGGQPPLKKKARKRRELRRRAKEAAREAAAAAAAEAGGEVTAASKGGGPPAKSAKRKRGKYIRRKPEEDEGRRRPLVPRSANKASMAKKANKAKKIRT